MITEIGYFILVLLGYLVGVRNLNGFSSGLAQAKVDISKLLANNVEMETYEGNVITLEATYRRLPPICS